MCMLGGGAGDGQADAKFSGVAGQAQQQRRHSLPSAGTRCASLPTDLHVVEPRPDGQICGARLLAADEWPMLGCGQTAGREGGGSRRAEDGRVGGCAGRQHPQQQHILLHFCARFACQEARSQRSNRRTQVHTGTQPQQEPGRQAGAPRYASSSPRHATSSASFSFASSGLDLMNPANLGSTSRPLQARRGAGGGAAVARMLQGAVQWQARGHMPMPARVCCT